MSATNLISIVTSSATPVIQSLVGLPAPVTVTVIPGANTALLEYTTSSAAKVTGGTANWLAWPAGAVTVNTSDTLIGPVTAVRLSRTVGAAQVEAEIVS